MGEWGQVRQVPHTMAKGYVPQPPTASLLPGAPLLSQASAHTFLSSPPRRAPEWLGRESTHLWIFQRGWDRNQEAQGWDSW